MLFSSELIQNKNYLKYRNLRAIVFTLFIFYCTPAYFILQNGESLAEDVQAMPWLKFYLIGVAIISVVYGILHYLSWWMKRIGVLEIFEDKIQCSFKDETDKVYPFKEIKKLEIIRNTTYHKEEEEMFKPYQANNWLLIQTNSSNEIKLEFLINSDSHNERFEKMLQELRQKLGRKFLFKSI